MTDGPYFIDFDNKTVLQFSCVPPKLLFDKMQIGIDGNPLPLIRLNAEEIELDDGRRIDVTRCANRMFAVHPDRSENISQDENGCYLYRGEPLPN